MSIKSFTALLLVIVNIQNCVSQITFQKSFTNGGYTIGRCVKQTTDGGYIFTGYTEVLGAGIQDVYLVKTDADGDTLWTKAFGGTQYDDGFSVEQTSDGGYIITGYTGSFGAGAEDVYLIKTNPTGNLDWSKTYGGTNMDRGASVRQTADGGFIIAGETLSYGAANHDLYIIKTDAVGDTLWTKVMGTTADNYAYDVIETLEGNFLVSGGHGPGGAYLVMLNIEGDSLWTKGFIAEGPAHLNSAYSVHQTADDGYVFAGIKYGVSGLDGYLQKTDNLGNPMWSKGYSGENHVYTTDMDITSDGGYILSGWSQAFPNGTYKSILIRTDESGDTLWTKRITGGGSYSSVQQTMDGGFILLSADNFNIYLTKTDENGNTGCDDSNAWPVVTDITPSVSIPAVAESFGGIVGNSSTLIESGGTINALCFECNLEVSFNTLPDTVCVDGVVWPLVGNPSDGVFSGEGVSNTSFNPATAGVGLHQLIYTVALSEDCTDADSISVFVDECILVNELNIESLFSIHPNPVDEELILDFSSLQKENFTVIIFDSYGQMVISTNFLNENCRLDTSNLPGGVYFCQVSSYSNIVTRTFLVTR